MPFGLLRRRGGYFVVNLDTGRRLSREPLPAAVARRQLRAVRAAYAGGRVLPEDPGRYTGGCPHNAANRRAFRAYNIKRQRYLEALQGAGWWDDITGFFTKAFDATIGKIPVVGDAVRAVAGTVLTPLTTVGNMAQAATEGDWSGVGKAAIDGVVKTVTAPSLAQVVTAGTPLAGVADLATGIAESVIPVGPGMTVSDLKEMALGASSLAQAAMGIPPPAEDATAGEEDPSGADASEVPTDAATDGSDTLAGPPSGDAFWLQPASWDTDDPTDTAPPPSSWGSFPNPQDGAPLSAEFSRSTTGVSAAPPAAEWNAWVSY